MNAMCKILKISRSLLYYKPKERAEEKKKNVKIENSIIDEFRASRNNYGTRKLKIMLKRKGDIVSRRRIGKIMEKHGLVSNYTIKQFKKHKNKTNEEKIENLVKRKFEGRKALEVVVSDLTYVNVGGKWNYICLLLDVSGREIIGFAAGRKKDAELVRKAFYSVKANLLDIEIFHTDRGSEFKNHVIDEIINAFGMKRSLSKKGCPYDNAVAEATYKIIKTEFAFNKIFKNFEQLEYLLFDYVNWFNNFRIHGSLNYLSPAEHKSLSSTNFCPN